jgi:hypothetical protein
MEGRTMGMVISPTKPAKKKTVEAEKEAPEQGQEQTPTEG